jgi:hypothetical protein
MSRPPFQQNVLTDAFESSTPFGTMALVGEKFNFFEFNPNPEFKGF